MRRIACLSVSAVLFASVLSAQSEAQAKPQTQLELAPLLDAFCQPVIDAEVAIGFVVGVIDGDRLEVRGYGKARLELDGAPDADTLFEIGSISKVFTGVLLAHAVARGEVALDDLAQKHMPEGKALPKTDANQIRIVDLATHMSGLPRLPDGMVPHGDDPYAAFTRESLYEGACRSMLRNEPGTVYEYSNLGTALLGQLLVDRAGASSYEQLLHDRVLKPLAMDRTSIQLTDAMTAMLASGSNADLAYMKPWSLAAFAPAGGIRSSMTDMMKFASAQWAPLATANSADPLAMAREKQRDVPGGLGIGLGWHIAKDGTTRWHNGETGGFHSMLLVRTEDRRAVCILANTATTVVDSVAELILQRLCGADVKPLKFEKPIAVADDQLELLCGIYEMQPGIAIAVTREGSVLRAQITGQTALRILPRSPTEFFYRQVQATIRFAKDGDEVTGLELEQAGRRSKWKKLQQKLR
jgi:CubicO group peptidase (beta-lactamase class C family)